MTDGETLAAVSLWSGFDGDPTAMCLFTLPVQPAQTVAEGDVVILNTCELQWAPAAQGLWTVGLVEAPAALATVTAGLPSVSAGPALVAITAPAAAATADAPAPTLVVLTPITAPAAAATADAPAPTVSGSAGITAPAASASASASAPTVTLSALKYILQPQLNVAVMHAATW
jgi:predicted RecA/RadA family phage recombinase